MINSEFLFPCADCADLTLPDNEGVEILDRNPVFVFELRRLAQAWILQVPSQITGAGFLFVLAFRDYTGESIIGTLHEKLQQNPAISGD
jgi:hypothetical protein